jgi:hypothetical protein
MSKIAYNEYFNRDDVFLRRLLVGALASLNLRIFWYNVLENNTQEKINIPFYFSTTGDERFLVDTFMRKLDADDTGCVAETFYNQIPRGIVNFESVSILEDAFTNRYIRGNHIVDSKDGELKTFSSEISSIPLSINLAITVYCDSHLDIMKCIESVIDNLYKHIEYNIEHKGIRCPASMEFTSDYNKERPIDFTYSDRKEFKATFDVSIKTKYPLIKSSSTMFAGNRMSGISQQVYVGSNNTFQYTQTNSVSTGNVQVAPPIVLVDPDVIQLMTLIPSTDINLQNALDKFTKRIKLNGVWVLCDAIYLCVGGTAAAHRYNFKNMLDSNAAFRLVFYGGYTHNSNGIVPNGINTQAETFYNLSTNGVLNDHHICIYSRTNISGLYADIGLTNSTTSYTCDIAPYYLTGFNKAFFRNQTTNGNAFVANANSLGVFINNRRNSFEVNAVINNLNYTIPSNSSSLINNTYFINASKDITGNGLYRSPRELSFISIGKGLSDAQALDYSLAIEELQVDLGRSVL